MKWLKVQFYRSILTVFCIAMSCSLVFAQNFADIPNQEFDEVNISEEMEQQKSMEVVMIPSEEDVEALPVMPSNFSTDSEVSSKYTLGKLDVIEITVQRHPEVTGIYTVNNEGKIQYEFVGDVLIQGLTKSEAKDKIVELLSTYIVSPEVTVKIAGYNSKVVYVIGEVSRPGKIYMRGDTITIREALVQAGLPLLSASTKKGRLITPTNNGKPVNKKVNINALLFEGDLRENLVMKPGDTLYIPPTGLTKVMRTISPVAAPIGTTMSTGRTVTTGF